MALAKGTRVVVLSGRHFDGFAEGDCGAILEIDREAASCLVAFDGRTSVPAVVALRHLGPEPPLVSRERGRREAFQQDDMVSHCAAEKQPAESSLLSPGSPRQQPALPEASGAALYRYLQQHTPISSAASAAAFVPVASRASEGVAWDEKDAASALADAVQACAQATSSASQAALAQVHSFRQAIDQVPSWLSKESDDRGVGLGRLGDALEEQRVHLDRVGEQLQGRLSRLELRLGELEVSQSSVREVSERLESLRSQVADKATPELFEELRHQQAEASKEMRLQLEKRFGELKLRLEEELASSKRTLQHMFQERLQTPAPALGTSQRDMVQQASVSSSSVAGPPRESSQEAEAEIALRKLVSNIDAIRNFTAASATASEPVTATACDAADWIPEQRAEGFQPTLGPAGSIRSGHCIQGAGETSNRLPNASMAKALAAVPVATSPPLSPLHGCSVGMLTPGLATFGTGATRTPPDASGRAGGHPADACSRCGSIFMIDAVYCRKCGQKRAISPGGGRAQTAM